MDGYMDGRVWMMLGENGWMDWCRSKDASTRLEDD